MSPRTRAQIEALEGGTNSHKANTRRTQKPFRIGSLGKHIGRLFGITKKKR
jgi:hypothetical protein